MNKSLIINKIKLHLGIKTDTEFADFLGVKQPTISAWRSRDTLDYELIIEKCKDINANWLLTGKGEMLKNSSDNSATVTITGRKDFIGLPIEEKLNIISQQVEELKDDNEKLSSKLDAMTLLVDRYFAQIYNSMNISLNAEIKNALKKIRN